MREKKRIEYSPISEEYIRTMKPGECIIVTPDGYREVNLYLYMEERKIIDVAL